MDLTNKEKNPRILLFIPMYNCEKQIVRVLGQLDNEILNHIDGLIVINNRSTDDGERAVIDYLAEHDLGISAKVLRNTENYGLGGSHKVAFQYAVQQGYDYVVVLHGDDQGHIDNLLPYLNSGEYKNSDCFLGARFMRGSVLDGYSAFRTFGNQVYDLLFSAVVRKRIFDLGSGLNLYSTKMLASGFYLKYPDNLMFNYCMILGSAYYKHTMAFFPIRWSEDDQVSNVKLGNQAIRVLKFLGAYAKSPESFVVSDHRDRRVGTYLARVVWSNGR